ncbi:hypothetical protein B7R54_16580 [Subtercola boreus]|uniref:Uncharacterized protein n=1 Tax=Subtercola boreus TaxID=120213 RepID=A0A3E0VMF2_9MICO|nr:hypothetical protein [Subtercola boreus]RFA10638.1 hypothetical protein B7R54_16580 [Subtercola boreus]TQL55805.1 hypothetical protein FB464_3379 [Subtercola boreus]
MSQTESDHANDGHPSFPLPSSTKPQNSAHPSRDYTRTVHHNGNRYFATAEMAEIFRSQAERIVERRETELIPLLHSRGVELLLVSPKTVFAVVTIEVGRPKVL